MADAEINDLPDSDFAYIEPGGKKVDGKTEPRSLRHFPIHDAAHVRNALARASQSPFGPKAMPKIRAAAAKFGIEMGGEGKALMEIKAEPLTNAALESWLAGERMRRIMVVPFSGPLPGGKAGLDLDGEYFDETTDLYGPFPALQRSRERLVDWHHDQTAGVPAGVPSMKGAILGKIILDDGPSVLKADDGDYEGVAADFWAKAGEQRLALIRALQRRGAAIYGSTQAVTNAVRKAEDGHIELWPIIRHTLSTSPQNIHAVIPSLKAMLMADFPDEVGIAALKAALVGLNDLEPTLRSTFGDGGATTGDGGSTFSLRGNSAGKAGRVLSSKNEALVAEIAQRAEQLLAQLRKLQADAVDEDTTSG